MATNLEVGVDAKVYHGKGVLLLSLWGVSGMSRWRGVSRCTMRKREGSCGVYSLRKSVRGDWDWGVGGW